MGLTPELLSDLRRKTDEASAANARPGDEGVHVVEVDPSDMRSEVKELEATVGELREQA